MAQLIWDLIDPKNAKTVVDDLKMTEAKCPKFLVTTLLLSLLHFDATWTCIKYCPALINFFAENVMLCRRHCPLY